MEAPALATALQRSYPAVDRIAALEPDLLAEALLRERLAERRGSALLDVVLGTGMELPVIARLAEQARAFKPGQIAAWAQVLIAAVARNWTHLPVEWLGAIHYDKPGLSDLLFTAWQQLDEPVQRDFGTLLRGPGTIKKLTSKGFGFVTGRDRDLFFHSSSLVDVAFNELREGDAVTYSIEMRPAGLNAINIQRA